LTERNRISHAMVDEMGSCHSLVASQCS
jgi:hypothetical protein